MSATASNGTLGVYFKDVPENSSVYSLGFRTNQILKKWEGKKDRDCTRIHDDI